MSHFSSAPVSGSVSVSGSHAFGNSREVHTSRSGSMYIRGTYMFSVHAPHTFMPTEKVR